jgi:ABC-type transport system involved in multi-copper enzyme maturation permease subunit
MWSAVLGKELQSRLRGWHWCLLLTLLILIFAGLAQACFWLIIASVPTIVPTIGQSVGTSQTNALAQIIGAFRGTFLFFAMALCLLSAMAVVAPTLASSAITGEREEATYDLLLASGIRPSAIVFGKVMATIVFMLTLAAALIPIFAVSWAFGGASLADVLLASAVIAASLYLFASIGVLCSAYSRSSPIAAVWAMLVTTLFGMGTVAVYIASANAGAESAMRPILALNPWIALITVPEQITGQVASQVPPAFRGLLDSYVSIDVGFGPIRTPRWMVSVGWFSVIGTLAMLLSAVAVDPCHRWRQRGFIRAISGTA